MSHEFTDPFPILQPAMHQVEVYGRLTDKVYKTLRDLYLRYNDYDWYLKADDDTFIFVDNLKTFLKTKNSSQPVTFGFDFKIIVEKGYHSGGAGYVLSNEALQRIGSRLSENYTFCSNSGLEDVDVAKCLNKLGSKQETSLDEDKRERFHPYDVKIHMKGLFGSWINAAAINPLKSVSFVFKLIIYISRETMENLRFDLIAAVILGFRFTIRSLPLSLDHYLGTLKHY